MLNRMARGMRSHESGFTLIEFVVVAAVLALLVALALPSYLGARNKAAIDEANGMAQEWRSLAYGCYLQSLDVTRAEATLNRVQRAVRQVLELGFRHPGRDVQHRRGVRHDGS